MWLLMILISLSISVFSKCSTWVWVNSGSWWWTGRPGMLQSMGLQRVGHDWVTELNFQSSAHRDRSTTPSGSKWKSQALTPQDDLNSKAVACSDWGSGSDNFLFKKIMFNWRIIALQYFVGVFYQTSTWISHRFTHVPSHLEHPSHLPSHGYDNF